MKCHYGKGLSPNEEKQLRGHILGVMNSGTGLAIEFAEMIYLDQLEDGRYRIFVQEDAHQDLCDGEEYIFDKAKDAVDFFQKMRRQLYLGFDFEGIHPLNQFLDRANIEVSKDHKVCIEVSEDDFERFKEFCDEQTR